MSGISFGGLASGLDTQAIISALLAVERRPIAQLEQKKSLLGSQKSLFGNIGGLLDDLVEEAKKIRLSTTFVDFKATTDKDTYLRASASSSATPGSYAIEVLDLAKAQVKSSAGKASATALDYAGGTLLFEIDGETVDVDLGSGTQSLESIAAAVNTADIGVRAQVIDTGAATNPFQLVFTAAEPGEDHEFTVTADPTSTSLDTLMTQIDGNVITPAQDARLRIDGIEITRSTNQITDVIAGVTIDLVGEDDTANTTTRITITADTAATSAKVKGFVDAYNKIVDFLEAQSEVDEEGNAQGALFGDVTLRTVRSRLRSIVGGSVSTGNEAYSLFAQIGIKSERSGRLTFTQSQFEAALTEDQDAVKRVFTDTTAGIANRIVTDVDMFTDTVDGMLKARKDGIERVTKSIDDSIRRAEERLEQYELNLVNRFANLEVLMNRLQGQGSSLSGINSIGFGNTRR